MTNQEAIEFLKNMIDREAIGFVCPEREGDVAIWQYHVEALQMAISALQAQEAKAQLSAEGTTSDLISRQAAIDRINKQREHLQPGIYPQDKIGDAAYRICAEFIERLPSAQPEIEERTEEFAQNVPKEDLISRKAAIDAVSQALKRTFVEYEDIARTIIGKLPSVEPEPLSDAYMKAVWIWLLDYQIKVAKLKGRYTPYEVLSWVANDWRKEHE